MADDAHRKIPGSQWYNHHRTEAIRFCSRLGVTELQAGTLTRTMKNALQGLLSSVSP